MRMKTILCGLFFLFATMGSRATDHKIGINFYESGMFGSAKVFFLYQVSAVAGDVALQAEAYFYLGECYLVAGQVDSARACYEKGRGVQPGYPYNLVGLGKLKVKGDSRGSEILFEEALSLKGYKKNVDLHLAIARAYGYVADHEKAMTYIELARKFDDKSGYPYLVEGDLLIAAGKVGEACAKYEMATYFSPGCVGAYVKQAQCYISTNRTLSLEKLNKALEVAPEFYGTYSVLGELYEMAGDSQAAVENYGKFMSTGFYDTGHQLRYAGILYFAKRYEEMLPVLETVLKAKADDLVAKRLYAYALSQQQDAGKCMEAIKHFIETTPPEHCIAQDYLCYAEQLLASKAYGEALMYYRKALKADAKRQELYKNMADILVKNQQLDSAIVYYECYMDFVKQPAAEDVLKLGKCYYNWACQDTVFARQESKLVKADTLFGTLAVQVPNSYVSYFWRARVNSMLDPETTKGLAKPYYEKVIEIGVTQPERFRRELIESYKYLGYYHYVLADAITTRNNGNPDPAKAEYGEAKVFFSKVLEIDAADEVAKKALDSIKI